MTRREVFDILRDIDKARCLHTIRHLIETNPTAIISALLEALEGSDQPLRLRAAQVLSVLHRAGDPTQPAVAKALASHLQADPSGDVRRSCAIGLLQEHSEEAEMAYIQALTDKNETVVELACLALGKRSDETSIAALFGMIFHPSWNVRRQACHSLITLKAADYRIVGTLECMAQEPEAATYDENIDKNRRRMQRIYDASPHEPRVEWWSKMGDLIARARQIAVRSD